MFDRVVNSPLYLTIQAIDQNLHAERKSADEITLRRKQPFAEVLQNRCS